MTNVRILVILLLLSFLYPRVMPGQKNHATHQLTGSYKSPNYSFFDKVYYNLFQRTTFIGNTTLELKEDSSFLLLDCYFSTGEWSVKEDSLLLHYETMNWRNDSARQHGVNGQWPTPPSYPIKYIIEDDMLRRRTTLYFDNKKFRGIDDLEKVSPKEK